ncbi:MAG: hypothetical protein OJF50_004096 [Nitrospira sp.]|nr:hypothetical protein [Nitrospira sp.]
MVIHSPFLSSTKNKAVVEKRLKGLHRASPSIRCFGIS